MDKYAKKIYAKDELLSALRDFGQEFAIPIIYLFGSYARGEANTDSDIDIVIDARNIHGLLQFEQARLALSDRLEKPVDMISMQAIETERQLPYRQDFMNSYLKERIEIKIK